MLKTIGRVVQGVRKTRGLRPIDVANDAGIPLPRLEALEAGKPGASTADLVRLADVLGIEPTDLLKGKQVDRPSFSVFLRHTGMCPDFVDGDLASLTEGHKQGRALMTLRELLGEPSGLFRASTFRTRPALSKGAAMTGHTLAREVRRTLDRPAAPLDDLRLLLETQFGIAVLVRDMRTSRATAFGLKAGHAAAALLSPSNRTVRGFLAHELCHILFDPPVHGVHVAIDRDDGDRQHVVAAEQRARGFAAELLLPEQGLTELLGRPRAISSDHEAVQMIARARDHFGATWPMTANHLCNLGFVQPELRGWLEALTGPSVEFSLVARQRTSLPPAGGPSRAVAELTQRAYERSLLTDADAREMLMLDDTAPLPWDE